MCGIELQKRHREANPDSVAESKRRSREKNQDAVSAYARRYRQENADAMRAQRQRYYDANRDALNESVRLYQQKNRDAILTYQQKYREENRPLRTSLQMKRKARQQRALPSWFGEFDEFVWIEAADLVVRRREATGFDWASDHMVPIASRTACGLHVADNCQVIPALLNNRKYNKMLCTERLEWLQHL